MLNLIALKRLAALCTVMLLPFMLGACEQSSAPPASGSRSYGTGSHAAFDIATPVGSGTATGSTINLSWSNGGTTGSEAPGGEFWGSTQLSCREGSGHTDVFMWNSTTSSWDELGSSKTGTYQLTNMADGEYTFKVKEKSLEGFSPNQMTHHSEDSEPFSVTVGGCVNHFSIGSTEQPGWNATQTTGIDPNGNQYTIRVKKASSANAAKFNLHFILAASCPDIAVTGHTVVCDVVEETAHGAITANEDLTTTGKYLANGIYYVNTVGTYNLKITVDGVEIYPQGTWKVQVIN